MVELLAGASGKHTGSTADDHGRLNKQFPATNMVLSVALMVFLRVFLVACLTNLPVSGATGSPPPHTVDTTQSTKDNNTAFESQPADGVTNATEVMTVALTDAQGTASSTSGTAPANLWSMSDKLTNSSTVVFQKLASTVTTPDIRTQDIRIPGIDLPETGTRMADVVQTPSLLPTPVIDLKSIQVTPWAIRLCLIRPVGPEGSVTYFLVTRSYLNGVRTWNGSHDLVNRTKVCLRKQDLTSGVPYWMYVVALDDDVGRSESEFLNITTVLSKIQIELDPVIDLLDEIETSATIDWSFGNRTHVERFVFSYNQTDDYPGGFRDHGSAVLQGDARHITLTGLYPGASYLLRLKGYSGPHSTTMEKRWIPATEPPSHLRHLSTTASSMELTWTFPPHTPPVLVRHFMVSYMIIADSRPRHKGHYFQWTNTTTILLDNLVPDAKYEVNVTTISINGRPSYARSLIHETGIASPRIISQSATSNSFTLVWATPKGNYRHTVTCNGCPSPVYMLGPGKTTATYAGLLSGNEYNGTITASKGTGAISEPSVYKTLTDPQGPASVYVKLSDPYGTQLEVLWNAYICTKCKVDFYTTSLWILHPPRQVQWKHSNCLQGMCRLTYDYLMPGQEYRAEVSAVRMNILSHPPVSSSSIRIRPSPVGTITFPKVTHNQIRVAWRRSFGLVDKYGIRLCEVDDSHPGADCNTYKTEVNSSTSEFNFLELKPNTQYNITLRAKSKGLESAIKWVVKATSSHYPQVDGRPPKAPSISEVTPYAFPVAFDTTFFDNSNGDIQYFAVLVAEASAVSHTNLPTYGNLSEGLQTRTWAKVIGQETIQRYQISERYPYNELISESGKRGTYAKKTITVGEEDCSEGDKDVYCNGPLKHNKIYVYQFRALTATGYADTPFSRHVMLPEDNTGVVAGISVTLAILFIIVLVLLGIIMGRKYRGNYSKYFAAKSMEPLPVSTMTRGSTSTRFSRPVRLIDFCHDFQVMNAHCHYGFSKEYESVNRVGRKITSNAAVLAANVSKNRYTNILPFDRTRVMLSSIDDVEGSDYINANYIAGYESPREFIACQGPLPGTVNDMWRMIWEQDVATVVMLTQLVEKATVKCDQYWEEDNARYLHGDIQVTSTNTIENENWHIRNFTLERNDATKKVQQFHYLAWPDHGVPDSSTTLLNFIKTVKKQIPKNGTPTIVHCSAGVGRTGTFVCLDHLMKHMEEFDFVDILGVVCDLRTQRSYMVQTEQQYVFIHKCVLDMLQEKGITPKRLPSISSIDTNDMASTRQGSNASTIPRPSVTGEDVVVFRSSRHPHDDDDEDEASKRLSTYNMGSPKKLLIETTKDEELASTPKRSSSSNGSVKKPFSPFKINVKEETV